MATNQLPKPAVDATRYVFKNRITHLVRDPHPLAQVHLCSSSEGVAEASATQQGTILTVTTEMEPKMALLARGLTTDAALVEQFKSPAYKKLITIAEIEAGDSNGRRVVFHSWRHVRSEIIREWHIDDSKYDVWLTVNTSAKGNSPSNNGGFTAAQKSAFIVSTESSWSSRLAILIREGFPKSSSFCVMIVPIVTAHDLVQRSILRSRGEG